MRDGMTEQGGRKPPLLSDTFPKPAGVKLQAIQTAITNENSLEKQQSRSPHHIPLWMQGEETGKGSKAPSPLLLQNHSEEGEEVSCSHLFGDCASSHDVSSVRQIRRKAVAAAPD